MIKNITILLISAVVVANILIAYIQADVTQLMTDMKKIPLTIIVLICIFIDAIILPLRLLINAKLKLDGININKNKLNYYVEFVKTAFMSHLPIGSLGADVGRIILLKSGIFEGVQKKKKSFIIFYDKLTGLLGIIIFFITILAYKNTENLLFIILGASIFVNIYKKLHNTKKIILYVPIILSIIGISLNTLIYYLIIHNMISNEINYFQVAYIVPLIIISNVLPLNFIIGMKELTGYLYFVSLNANSALATTLMLALFSADILSKLITVSVAEIIRNIYDK